MMTGARGGTRRHGWRDFLCSCLGGIRFDARGVTIGVVAFNATSRSSLSLRDRFNRCWRGYAKGMWLIGNMVGNFTTPTPASGSKYSD